MGRENESRGFKGGGAVLRGGGEAIVESIVSLRGRNEPMVLESGDTTGDFVCTLSASTAEADANDRDGGRARFVPGIHVGVDIPDVIIPGVG